MSKNKRETPKEETKAQRFRRVIEPRVGKALKAIRLVGSVTGSSYECDTAQIAAISSALEDAVTKATDRLSGKGGASGGFTL